MGSASIHRVGSTERVQFTVAELLGRCGGEVRPGEVRSGAIRAGGVGSVPAVRPGGATTGPSGASVRRRLVSAAGTVVVAGTFAAGAVLPGPATYGGGPLGTEAAGAGHPVAEPRATRAVPATPRRVVTPVARVVQVRPVARPPVRRSSPTVRPLEVPEVRDTRRVRDRGTVRAPAGSALSGLTPAITIADAPVDALSSVLDRLGR